MCAEITGSSSRKAGVCVPYMSHRTIESGAVPEKQINLPGIGAIVGNQYLMVRTALTGQRPKYRKKCIASVIGQNNEADRHSADEPTTVFCLASSQSFR